MTEAESKAVRMRIFTALRILTYAAGLAFIVLLGVGLLEWDGVFLVAAAAVGAGGLALLQLLTYATLRYQLEGSTRHFTRVLKRTALQEFRQVEALASLYGVLDIRHPLPRTREWAASPDFANVLVRLIQERKPELIVEASSGVSTLICAYALRGLGQGRVISLDHAEEFALATQREIELHGLSDIANVVHAPLTKHLIADKAWLWYDLAALPDARVDMLVIDGPPMDVQTNARFPALPLLMVRLAKSGVVVLDDAARYEEKRTVELWLDQFDGFDHEYVDTEKGTSILRRKAR